MVSGAAPYEGRCLCWLSFSCAEPVSSTDQGLIAGVKDMHALADMAGTQWIQQACKEPRSFAWHLNSSDRCSRRLLRTPAGSQELVCLRPPFAANGSCAWFATRMQLDTVAFKTGMYRQGSTSSAITMSVVHAVQCCPSHRVSELDTVAA